MIMTKIMMVMGITMKEIDFLRYSNNNHQHLVKQS